MDAVSYPSLSVVSFITENVVPLRVSFDTQPLATQFNLQWTPTLITLDSAGKEHHRTVGFLPPEELVPSLLLGTAKCDFENGQFQDAEAVLVRLLKEYPKGGAAPEALYLLGVTRYKAFHDPKPLKDAYERLHVEYPGSEWEKRAYPYRLL